MGRILALDWGTKRIGVALSDLTKIIAQASKENLFNDESSFKKLKKMIRDYEVEKIVLGLPRTLKGTSGRSSKEVKKFADEIKKISKVPIEFVDERFTTRQAGETLKIQKISSRGRKEMIDSASAQQLLQQYLDSSYAK